jgi:hypothetical protein
VTRGVSPVSDISQEPAGRLHSDRRRHPLPRGVGLALQLPFEKLRLRYEYDVGDGWEYALVMEKLLEPEEDAQYPRCIAGKMACPPEDCGGMWGYVEFLEAIQNPEHEDHETLLNWVGGAFEPRAFDPGSVNLALQKVGVGRLDLLESLGASWLFPPRIESMRALNPLETIAGGSESPAPQPGTSR